MNRPKRIVHECKPTNHKFIITSEGNRYRFKKCTECGIQITEPKTKTVGTLWFSLTLLSVVIFLAPSFLRAAEPPPPPRIGVAVWVDQKGRPDKGISYDMATFPSHLWNGHWCHLGAVLGSKTGGATWGYDLYDEGATVVSLAGGMVTPNGGAGTWSFAAILTIRTRK